MSNFINAFTIIRLRYCGTFVQKLLFGLRMNSDYKLLPHRKNLIVVVNTKE